MSAGPRELEDSGTRNTGSGTRGKCPRRRPGDKLEPRGAKMDLRRGRKSPEVWVRQGGPWRRVWSGPTRRGRERKVVGLVWYGQETRRPPDRRPLGTESQGLPPTTDPPRGGTHKDLPSTDTSVTGPRRAREVCQESRPGRVDGWTTEIGGGRFVGDDLESDPLVGSTSTPKKERFHQPPSTPVSYRL